MIHYRLLSLYHFKVLTGIKSSAICDTPTSGCLKVDILLPTFALNYQPSRLDATSYTKFLGLPIRSILWVRLSCHILWIALVMSRKITSIIACQCHNERIVVCCSVECRCLFSQTITHKIKLLFFSEIRDFNKSRARKLYQYQDDKIIGEFLNQ